MPISLTITHTFDDLYFKCTSSDVSTMLTIVPCDLLHLVPASLEIIYPLLFSRPLHGFRTRIHGVERHRMPGYVMARRQLERKLATFQATCRANVYRTSQIQNTRGKSSHLLIWVRQKGISTTRGLTSPTMTVRN